MCRASWISFSSSSWAGGLTCEAALEEAEGEDEAEDEGEVEDEVEDEVELEGEAELDGEAELEGGDVEAWRK